MSAVRSALARPGAQVLLAGTGTHAAGSVLPDLPQVARTVADLGDVLVRCGGLAPGNLRTMIDPVGPAELGEALVEAAQAAEDLLVFHFIGHGLVSLGRELHLATGATRDLSKGLATYQALPFSEVRTALLSSRASSVLVVLDCCFSGRARGALGNAAAEAFRAGHVEGAYLLTATANNESALSPPGAEHTTFSGTLLTLLRDGDPSDAGAPPALTLDYLVGRLRRQLTADGHPQPRNQAADRVGELVLAPNPAWRPPAPRPDRSPGAAPDDPAAVCPYPGLVPFEAADASLFFGREDLTADLIDLVGDGGPVVVVGPSGAGKSSLLRAGLLGTVGRSRPTLLVTPTSQPTAELRERLLRELPDQPASTSVAALVEAAPPELLVVVDQFEELFTACTDEAERVSYVATLCSLKASVVLGVRADFYGRLAHYPQLLEIMKSRQILVGPMTQAQVRTAIDRPATSAGLTLEDGLCDLVLRDYGRAEADSSPLPFLAHALRVTWTAREGRLLTFAGYETSGGIWHAVRSTADAVYEALGSDDRRIARDVLLRMVRIDENNDHTRRRLDLASLPAPEATSRAVAALADARLITVHADEAEISHEALIRAWPRLTEWIEADRAVLVARQRLADATAAWQRERHDPNLLYQGARLADAESQFGGVRRAALSRGERDFLDAGRDRSQRRTRRLRQVIALLASLLLVAVGAGLLAVVQWRDAETQTRRAISEQLTVQARALAGTEASLSVLLDVEALQLNRDNGRARADLAHSLIGQPRHTATIKTTRVARMMFQPGRPVLLTQGAEGLRLWNANTRKPLAAVDDQPVSWSAFSPDGTVLGVVADNGRSAIYDVADAAKPARLSAVPVEKPTTIAFAPSHRLAAVTTAGLTTVLLNTTDPSHPAVLTTVSTRGNVSAEAYSNTGGATFSPDGATMATGSDGTIILWDIASPDAPRQLASFTSGSVGSGDDLAFNSTGTRLAITGGDAGNGLSMEARTDIWDVRDRAHPTRRATIVGEQDLNPYGVAFSPRRDEPDLLVIAGSDGVTTLYDLTDTATPQLTAELTGGVDTARSEDSGIAFSLHSAVALAGDGRTMATTQDDGVVHLWDRSWAQPVQRAVLPAQGPAAKDLPGSVAFSPDGRMLVSAVGGRGALWDVTDPAWEPTLLGLLNPPEWRADVVVGTSFRDPSALITTGRLGTPALWDLRRPENPVWRPFLPLDRLLPGIWTTVATSPNGGVLATAPDPRLLDAYTGTRHPAEYNLLQRHTGQVAVAFRPRGSVLAVVDDRILSLWSFDERLPQLHNDAMSTRQLTDRGKGPLAAAFSADGKVLLTSSGGRTELWSTTGVDPVRLAELPAPQASTVRAAAFNASGSLLATADATRTTLWSIALVNNPVALAEIPVGVSVDSGSTALAFGPGDRLAVAAPGGTQLWDVSAAANGLTASVDDLIRNACAIVGPGITERQWKTYVPQLGYGSICD